MSRRATVPKSNTTTCQACQKQVRYRSRKPKYCLECRRRQATLRTVTRHSGERAALGVLKEICADYDFVINGYYSWLRSPKGEPMQLDFFCPALLLAVEYNGIQHYEFSPRFHKTREDFEYRKKSDALKREICETKGIHLIELKTSERLDPETMLKRLQKEAPEAWRQIREKGQG